MKAIRYTDGRVEFDGTVEEITRVFGTQPSGVSPGRAPATPPATTTTPITGPRPAGSRVPGSLPARIAALLTAAPERTFTIAEIAQALGVQSPGVRNLSGALNRMARESPPVIRNAGRGRYRAATREGA